MDSGFSSEILETGLYFITFGKGRLENDVNHIQVQCPAVTFGGFGAANVGSTGPTPPHSLVPFVPVNLAHVASCGLKVLLLDMLGSLDSGKPYGARFGLEIDELGG